MTSSPERNKQDELYDYNPVTKGVLLLILCIAGNFMAEMLGCNTQMLLSNNMVAKHIITFAIIYFAIDFSTDSKYAYHPIENLKISICIYILFIMFVRLESNYSGIVFILLSLAYFTNNYISYYDKMGMKEDSLRLHRVRNALYVVMTFIILMGYYEYYTRQRVEKGGNWSTSKFIFGTTRCNYLNRV